MERGGIGRGGIGRGLSADRLLALPIIGADFRPPKIKV